MIPKFRDLELIDEHQGKWPFSTVRSEIGPYRRTMTVLSAQHRVKSDRESVQCLASKRTRAIGSRKQKIAQKSSPSAQHRTCPRSRGSKDIRQALHFHREIKCLQ